MKSTTVRTIWILLLLSIVACLSALDHVSLTDHRVSRWVTVPKVDRFNIAGVTVGETLVSLRSNLCDGYDIISREPDFLSITSPRRDLWVDINLKSGFVGSVFSSSIDTEVCFGRHKLFLIGTNVGEAEISLSRFVVEHRGSAIFISREGQREMVLWTFLDKIARVQVSSPTILNQLYSSQK